MVRVLLVSGVLVGCLHNEEPGEGPPAPAPATTTPTEGTTTGSTTSSTTTSSTTSPSSSTWDCEALSTGPLPGTLLSGLHAAEDFGFDDQGNLISHYVNALYLQSYPPVTATPFAPTTGGPGGPASLRMLHDGDLVYANVDTATLYRVGLDGSSVVLNSSLGYPGGIDIHDSGDVFLVDLVGTLRIDPVTGDTDVLLPGDTFFGPNGLTFSADYSTLYIGTWDGIMAVPVDEEGTPTDVPTLFAESPNGGELLGMGVDACDNVYALWDAEVLLRWGPEGSGPETLFQVPPGAWLTNLQWGSGLGGWDAHSIYIVDRQNGGGGYYEVPVGVPAKPAIP